ncbi:type III secretion system inner rod subunit SctI [Pseudomonas batumici]|uniref:type III secretion system inner rod subunit SctI n=1 Tax=Pseudomonas batumici TaxID=226910 RepID=UPI0030D164A2
MIRIDALPGAGGNAMDLSVDDSSMPEQGLISLTARAASASEAQKLGMLETALSAAETGNPAEMLRAFSMAQDHHLQVETIAVCTRKMVSAVETLLKS